MKRYLRRGQARSNVLPHQHLADPGVPADHRGRQRCSVCGLMGEPGDAHHPDPALPRPSRPFPAGLIEAAQQREAAILGEKDDLE